MQRRNRPVDEAVQEGIVQHVDMEMQHVELGRERPHLFEHYDMMRDRILDAWVKPQRDFARWLEFAPPCRNRRSQKGSRHAHVAQALR